MAERNYQRNRDHDDDQQQRHNQPGDWEDQWESRGYQQRPRGRDYAQRDGDYGRNDDARGERQNPRGNDFQRGGGYAYQDDTNSDYGDAGRRQSGGGRSMQSGGYGNNRSSYSSDWEQNRGGERGNYQGSDQAGGGFAYGSSWGGARGNDYGNYQENNPQYRDQNRSRWGGQGHGNTQGGTSAAGNYMGSGREMWGNGEGNRQGQSHRGRGPKNYSRSDDRIQDDVCDRLSDDESVDASGIEVSVSEREVTLSGEVDSKQAKRAAEDCAEAVSGVNHVQNNLRVKDSQSQKDSSETGRSKSKL